MGELPASDVLLFKAQWRMEEEQTGLWGHLGLLTAVKCHALMFHIVTYTVFNLVSADSSCMTNFPSRKCSFSTEILILICRTFCLMYTGNYFSHYLYDLLQTVVLLLQNSFTEGGASQQHFRVCVLQHNKQNKRLFLN